MESAAQSLIGEALTGTAADDEIDFTSEFVGISEEAIAELENISVVFNIGVVVREDGDGMLGDFREGDRLPPKGLPSD